MGTFATDDNSPGCGCLAVLFAGLIISVGIIRDDSLRSASDIGAEVCPIHKLCSRDLPPTRVAELTDALDGTASAVVHLDGGRIEAPLSPGERARLVQESITSRIYDIDRDVRELERARTMAERLQDAIRDFGGPLRKDASEDMATQAGL
ncbi:hypothetical protein [Sphingomonas lacusdianchii]|uniref:hypothetical protein n=1 Tax=Sphingomonas lacusdianchii TaxID=2917992 RepID=UPI001F590128|nr:hypothetical protein [Sphingomonas sp. JXJ CY 53]